MKKHQNIFDEFYAGYKEVEKNLITLVIGKIHQEQKKIFAENLLLQIAIIWYLQSRGFFNGNKQYLIDTFQRYTKIPSNELYIKYKKKLCCQTDNTNFTSFYEFLICLFSIMKDTSSKKLVISDKELGNIVVTGPIPFLECFKSGTITDQPSLPDNAFYQSGEIQFKNDTRENSLIKIPIFNFFNQWEWKEGEIDHFVIGAIFEKQLNKKHRKRTGTFYTPKKITRFMSEEVINLHLAEKLHISLEISEIDSTDKKKDPSKKKKKKKKYFQHQQSTNIYDIIRKSQSISELTRIYGLLSSITICDPSVGAGHFLESISEYLLKLHLLLYHQLKKIEQITEKHLITLIADDFFPKNNLFKTNDENLIKFYVLFYLIYPKNIYGVDLDPNATKVAKARLFLYLSNFFPVNPHLKLHEALTFADLKLNVKSGNSLIGYTKNPIHNEQKNGSLASVAKLNTLFAQKKKIPLDQVEKLYPFHWNKAFPFLADHTRFDIIIGNPPYLSFFSTKSKKNPNKVQIYTQIYPTIEDIYEAFILRSLELSNSKIGFIIPYSFYRQLGEKITQNIISYHNLGENIFVGVKNAVSIVFLDQNPQKSFFFYNYLFHQNKLQNLKQVDFFVTNSFNFYKQNSIINFVDAKSKRYRDYNIKISRGEEYGRKSLLNQKLHNSIPIFSAKEMRPFTLKQTAYFISRKKIKKTFYEQNKVGVNLAFRNRIKASYIGPLITIKSIICIYGTSKENLFEILGFWNSKLFDYYHHVRYCLFEERRVNKIRDIKSNYPIILRNDSIVKKITQCLIIDPTNQRLRFYLDNYIYLLYFKDLLLKSLNIDQKMTLFSQKLSDLCDQVNFLLFENLYFKKISQSITQTENRQFIDLTNNHQKEIGRICQIIDLDPLFQSMFKEIQQYPWVKQIENYRKKN